jgi:hypothetical protein
VKTRRPGYAPGTALDSATLVVPGDSVPVSTDTAVNASDETVSRTARRTETGTADEVTALKDDRAWM